MEDRRIVPHLISSHHGSQDRYGKCETSRSMSPQRCLISLIGVVRLRIHQGTSRLRKVLELGEQGEPEVLWERGKESANVAGLFLQLALVSLVFLNTGVAVCGGRRMRMGTSAAGRRGNAGRRLSLRVSCRRLDAGRRLSRGLRVGVGSPAGF